MKVLISPDSFKGCLSSIEVCNAIEKGIKCFDSDIEIIKIPSSDGGEGFCDCMLNLFDGEKICLEVASPLGRRVPAEYLLNEKSKTAYIEFASAAGLPLVSEDERNILESNSFGVGQLIANAIKRNVKQIVIGLGGSATNDCGLGLLSALGVRFLDNNGNVLLPIPLNLDKICFVDKSEMIDISQIEFIAACDVKNPLCGEYGAARIFAPQKGADESEVAFLDYAARRYADVIGIDPDGEGYGAAGGAGMALMVFLGATYISGAELLVNSQTFTNEIASADLVITGEGKTDTQSLFGKLVGVVVSEAEKRNKRVAIISGAFSDGFNYLSTECCYALCDDTITVEYSIAHARELLEKKSKELITDVYNHR